MVLLKFGLLCTKFLAWPVIALLYPLFASIRAIETGSKYHMKKLVIYWTLFSLISLFEYVFVKIIEWVPFWSSIKLVVIYWLAIPRFHGACYAYKSFIYPCLVVNIREVIRRFEEQSRTKETLVHDVTDNDKGLEKFIAAKREHKESYDSQKDTNVLESDQQNAGATLKLLKVAEAAQRDKEILEAPEESDIKAQRSVASEETTYAAVLTKGILPTPTLLIPQDIRDSSPSTLIDKVEWTCTLCQVTTSSEDNLNDHLRGKKHKDMCDSLKSVKLVNAAAPQDHHNTKWPSNHQQKFCTLCKVTASSERNLIDHLRGKKHKDMCESLRTTKLVNHTTKEIGESATHHFCFLCNAEMVGQASLASHLKGKRHMSNVETMGKT